jgi:hypothetical protein
MASTTALRHRGHQKQTLRAVGQLGTATCGRSVGSPSEPRAAASMTVLHRNDQHRDGRLVKDLVADAAQHHRAQLAMPSRSHRDEIVTGGADPFDDRFADAPFEQYRACFHPLRDLRLGAVQNLVMFASQLLSPLRQIRRQGYPGGRVDGRREAGALEKPLRELGRHGYQGQRGACRAGQLDRLLERALGVR